MLNIVTCIRTCRAFLECQSCNCRAGLDKAMLNCGDSQRIAASPQRLRPAGPATTSQGDGSCTISWGRPDEARQQLEALSLLVQTEESQQHVSVTWSAPKLLLPALSDHVFYTSPDCDGISVAKLCQPAEQGDQHTGH